MELISIIVPVYNVEQYLPKCLDSIINQTYKNIEIILVDDGSTDNSGKMCDEYAYSDTRVRVFHKENSGVVEARIDGFNNSNGDFLVFVDSDDYISLDCIENMIRIQREYDVALVCSQYVDVKNGVEKVAPIRPGIGYYDRTAIIDLLKSNFLFDEKTKIAGMSPFLWTKLIKRKFVKDILIIGRGLFYAEDQVGVFKLLCNIPNMHVMQDAFYYYVKREGQATQKYDEKLWDNIEKYFNKFEQIDKEGYLTKQLQGRRLFYLFMLVNMEAKHSRGVFDFIKVMRLREKSIIFKDVFTNSFNEIDIKHRIMYSLIKSRNYYLYYFLYQIKRRLMNE